MNSHVGVHTPAAPYPAHSLDAMSSHHRNPTATLHGQTSHDRQNAQARQLQPQATPTPAIPIKRLIDEDVQFVHEKAVKKLCISRPSGAPVNHSTATLSTVPAAVSSGHGTPHRSSQTQSEHPENAGMAAKANVATNERRSSTGNIALPTVSRPNSSPTPEPRGVSLPVPLPKTMANFTFQQPPSSAGVVDRGPGQQDQEQTQHQRQHRPAREESADISPKHIPKTVPPNVSSTAPSTQTETRSPTPHAPQPQHQAFFDPYNTPGYHDVYGPPSYYDAGPYGYPPGMGTGIGMNMSGMPPAQFAMASESAFGQRVIHRVPEYPPPPGEVDHPMESRQEQQDQRETPGLAQAANASVVRRNSEERPLAAMTHPSAGAGVAGSTQAAESHNNASQEPARASQQQSGVGGETSNRIPAQRDTVTADLVPTQTPESHHQVQLSQQHTRSQPPHGVSSGHSMAPTTRPGAHGQTKGPCQICARIRQQRAQNPGMPQHQYPGQHGGHMLMPSAFPMHGNGYGMPQPSVPMQHASLPQTSSPPDAQMEMGHQGLGQQQRQMNINSILAPQQSHPSVPGTFQQQMPQHQGYYPATSAPSPMQHSLQAPFQQTSDQQMHYQQDAHPQQPSMATPPPPSKPQTSTPTAPKKPGPASTIVTAASTRLNASPEAQRKPSPNLYVDIAETCLEQFPYAEVARRHAVSRQRVVDVFTAVVQLPLLRCPTDKRRVGRLGVSRMKEYNKARKELAAKKEREKEERERRGEVPVGGGGGGNVGVSDVPLEKGKGKGKIALGLQGKEDGLPGVYEVAQFMGPAEMSDSLRGAISGSSAPW